jgi:hypothetical protein
MLAKPHNHRIPLFHGEKQQKPLIPTPNMPNLIVQVIDSNWVRREFPYAAEQRNFTAYQRN